jgi:hypothetical protein
MLQIPTGKAIKNILILPLPSPSERHGPPQLSPGSSSRAAPNITLLNCSNKLSVSRAAPAI